jgi:catechol 2,3-dioxygenase-like lactoylglutathione lyase family enzyme
MKENRTISLDHMILRVRKQAESLRFYQQVLTFKHEGRAGPFDILRVHDGFTLDLMEQAPQDQVHLAFCLERAAFVITRRASQRLWHFNFRGPDEERLVQRRERIYLDRKG